MAPRVFLVYPKSRQKKVRSGPERVDGPHSAVAEPIMTLFATLFQGKVIIIRISFEQFQ